MIVPCPNRFFALAALALLALTPCPVKADSSELSRYDAKLSYEKGGALRFPDFEMTYAGKRHVIPPQYPRGWWVYDFVVRSKSGEQTVSWSAGTGDIGPTRFKVNGAEFQIELSRSDKLGVLRDGELVVSKVRQ